MAMPALQLEPEIHVEEQLARLEATVEHIQSDVTEIKADRRRLHEKLDALVGVTNTPEVRIENRFGDFQLKVEKRFGDLEARIEKRFGDFEARMERRFSKVEEALGELRVGRALDRVWWLLMCGVLLVAMARGFKWL